jgi:hypothetical protein
MPVFFFHILYERKANLGLTMVSFRYSHTDNEGISLFMKPCIREQFV